MAVKPHNDSSRKLELVPYDYFRELSPSEIFVSEERPLDLDLGCGDGSFLIQSARTFPERNFIGVERLLGRVRKVCRRGAREGLTNLKVLRLESRYTLRWLLPSASISRLHFLFPDPWPKERHSKKRLFRQDFAEGLERVLKVDGQFFFKSDHPEYFAEAMEFFLNLPCLRRESWPSDSVMPYPKTDFEEKWLNEGRHVHRATFRRIPIERYTSPSSFGNSLAI